MNQYRNLINGEWVAGDHWRPNVSPSDSNDVIGEYADADALQTEIAAAAAREAFRSWSKSGPQERFELLVDCVIDLTPGGSGAKDRHTST